MEPIVQKATTILTVDGEQAKNEIDDINVKLKDLDKALKKADKENDHALHKSLTSQKNKLLANRTALQKHIVDVNKVLNNLSAAKPKELSATIVALTKQLNDPSIKRGSGDWKQMSEKINLCKKELASVNSELQIGQSQWNKSTGFISKYASFATAAIASITGIGLALNDFRKKSNAQEEGRADLKALTGLDNESIAWLEQEAVRLSTTVTESGIRIRQSATEILDAFKLVGSAKPELLENKEALEAVTEQALILASASGMNLTDAVEGVTLALNQYGEGAGQAARYVNVLAAGSKYGAAAVESQTKTIRTAGVAAAGAKIPIEELQGTIQTLAERGIKDEVAGTGLKKFFLTLQTGAKDTNPAIIGLSAALQNLSDKHLSAAQIKKQFGEEGYNVAKVLIDNKDKFEQYTTSVTDTNVALEQSREKSNTVASAMDQAGNAVDQTGISLMELFNPALLKATSLTTQFVKGLILLPDLFKSYWQWLLLVVVATASYNSGIIISTALKYKDIAVDKIKYLWTNKLTIAQTALNIAIKANPIGLLITGITALAAAFITWYNSSIKVQAVTGALWESVKYFGSRVAEVFKGIWTIFQGGFWGNKASLLKAWKEGTSLINKATSDMGEGIANAFWNSYNKTMSEGQKKAEKPEKITTVISSNTSATDEPDPIDEEAAKKAAKEAERKREKEKKAALEANKNMYTALKAQLKQQYLDQEINEATMNRMLELMDMESIQSRINILKKYGEDVASEEEQLLDKRISMVKKAKEAGSLSLYISGNQEEEEADPELDKLIERTKKSYEYKQAALKDQYSKGLLTQKEYQDQERELLEEHLTEMLSSRMNFANQVNQVAGQAAQLVSALSQREEIAVENKYAGQLKAAKGNAEKTAAINEQMEEEKKAVKKKYADIDFAITAAQIIASTAAGLMQLWAKPGWPAALPLMAVVGATGIAQLLLANEQRQQVKNLWTGGYTSPGQWDEPKGIVHSEEFVGNRFAVRNKPVNRVFRMIDLAQKNNTIASINETDIIRSLGAVRSGSSEKEIVYRNAPSGVDPKVAEALILVSRSVSDLKRQMEEGTLARTYVTGDGGTKTARDKYDKMLKNVTRYTKK